MYSNKKKNCSLSLSDKPRPTTIIITKHTIPHPPSIPRGPQRENDCANSKNLGWKESTPVAVLFNFFFLLSVGFAFYFCIRAVPTLDVHTRIYNILIIRIHCNETQKFLYVDMYIPRDRLIITCLFVFLGGTS